MLGHDLSELGLLGVFYATAVGLTLLTFDFQSSSAAQFPRLMAAVVIVGVTLLVFREFLPGPLYRLVAEPVDLVDREELEAGGNSGADAPDEGSDGENDTAVDDRESTGSNADAAGPTDSRADAAGSVGSTASRADSAASSGATGEVSAADRPLTARQFTFVAITAYVVAAPVLSILVSTPLFVLGYALWFRHRWYETAALVVASLVVVGLFVELANAPLDDGMIFGGGI